MDLYFNENDHTSYNDFEFNQAAPLCQGSLVGKRYCGRTKMDWAIESSNASCDSFTCTT